MNASEEQLEVMAQMQKAALAQAKAEKTLEDLPQRQAIVELRQKRATIEKKIPAVQKMLKAQEQKLVQIEDEDARAAAKQKEDQQVIEESGDFREVSARSKELESLAKRREELSKSHDEAVDQLEQIRAVSKQIEDALTALQKKEEQEIATFREQGTALQRAAAQAKAEYARLAALLPKELLEAFEQAAQRSGGVALGMLIDGHCSCCRTTFDAGRLSQIKAEAPLATCPNCKRLLAV